eukprot:Sdes_comp9934_c0_seq1m1483
MSGRVLCVWVHGFEGDASTFGEFPELLEEKFSLETIKYYYESSKVIDEVVEGLTELLKPHLVAGGQCPKRVIFCGHSCGGLVIGRYLKTRFCEKQWTLLGICLFDSPLRGIDQDKVLRHSKYLKDVLESKWKLTLFLGAILVLLGKYGGPEITEKVQTQFTVLTQYLNSRHAFLKILFGSWAQEREDIIQLYEKYSIQIPVLNVFVSQSSFNYFCPCQLASKVENYEFGQGNSKLAVFHPLVHTLLFREKSRPPLPIVGTEQDNLYRTTCHMFSSMLHS